MCRRHEEADGVHCCCCCCCRRCMRTCDYTAAGSRVRALFPRFSSSHFLSCRPEVQSRRAAYELIRQQHVHLFECGGRRRGPNLVASFTESHFVTSIARQQSTGHCVTIVVIVLVIIIVIIIIFITSLPVGERTISMSSLSVCLSVRTNISANTSKLHEMFSERHR